MSKARDPKYKQGNEFSDEELNPNRKHEYREKTGESPISNIHKIMAMKTPEERAEIEEKRIAKMKETKSMKKRAKEILEMAIQLNPAEQEGFLEGLKTKGEITVQDAMLFGQVSKSIKEQDTSATTFMRDTSGQKPKDEVEHIVNIDKILKDAGAFDEEDDIDED